MSYGIGIADQDLLTNHNQRTAGLWEPHQRFREIQCFCIVLVYVI
ncbi:Uncharacterised protein [Vibrio cholerae]|nr:Uncharacterised protein [Vibrio cholerae]